MRVCSVTDPERAEPGLRVADRHDDLLSRCPNRLWRFCRCGAGLRHPGSDPARRGQTPFVPDPVRSRNVARTCIADWRVGWRCLSVGRVRMLARRRGLPPVRPVARVRMFFDGNSPGPSLGSWIAGYRIPLPCYNPLRSGRSALRRALFAGPPCVRYATDPARSRAVRVRAHVARAASFPVQAVTRPHADRQSARASSALA